MRVGSNQLRFIAADLNKEHSAIVWQVEQKKLRGEDVVLLRGRHPELDVTASCYVNAKEFKSVKIALTMAWWYRFAQLIEDQIVEEIRARAASSLV